MAKRDHDEEEDAFENMTEKRMLYETYLLQKQMDKRMDRHSAQHRDDIDRLHEDNTELKKTMESFVRSQGSVNSDHGTRLTKLESEKTVWGKVVQPLITIATGVAGVLIGKALSNSHLFSQNFVLERLSFRRWWM